MPKWDIECKTWVRRKGTNIFEDYANAYGNSEDEKIYETYRVKNEGTIQGYHGEWITKIKTYGCGGEVAFTHESPTRPTQCPRCKAPQNGSPPIKVKKHTEEGLEKIDWSFDYWKAFDLNTNANDQQINVKYKRLCLRLSPEKAGNNEEKKQAYEACFKDIQKAYVVLKSKITRDFYNYSRKDQLFACAGCVLAKNLSLEKMNCVFTPSSSLRWFHSPECAKAYNAANNYDKVKKYNVWQVGWSGVAPTDPPPDKDKPDDTKWNKRNCAGCGKNLSFREILWKRWSEKSNVDWCCTDKCLIDYWTKQGNCPDGKPPRECFECGKMKKEMSGKTDTDYWHKVTDKNYLTYGRIFCSKKHQEESEKRAKEGTGLGGFGRGSKNLDKEKQRLVSDIQGLDGWDKLSTAAQDDFIQRIARVSKKEELDPIWTAVQDAIRNYFNNLRQTYIDEIKALDKLTEVEKQGFIDLINTNGDDNFDNILNQAKAANQAKGGGNTSQVLKNMTIAAISGELLKDPAVETTELENSNQNWRKDIESATKDDQITAIKNRIFADIGRKRVAKQIVNLRQVAIQKICSELTLEPAVAASELDNQDWEKEINSSSDQQIIANILAKVLADIRSKREIKLERDKINQLLAEAKQNWNNYQNLENILQKIKKLRSSDVYSQKESEIKAIEDQLRKIDQSKFAETTKNSLKQQIKDNSLSEKDLDAETKAAKKLAEENPTDENIKKAEEGIATCGAKKELTNILQKVKKAVDQRDKESLINEILMFLKKNKYTRKVSEIYKHEIETSLAKLRGETQPENTSPDKPPYLAFALLLIGGSAMVAVFAFLIWKKKKRLVAR